MSDKPIVVVHGNSAQGESRFIDLSDHDVFVASVDDLMNAPDDVAAAYREFVEARGESPTDMSLIVECSGSIRQDLMEAMRGEVLKIKPPMATVVFDEEINTISPRSTYLPRKDKDWQQNQKRGRMKPRR